MHFMDPRRRLRRHEWLLPKGYQFASTWVGSLPDGGRLGGTRSALLTLSGCSHRGRS